MAQIKVGIVGTGFVANLRAELFAQSPEALVVGFAGTPHRSEALAEKFNAGFFEEAEDLINLPSVNLIVVANTNCDHYKTVKMALDAGKNVVVEYPAALSYQEGLELWELAVSKQKLLHIEHIELLGGVHQAMTQNLDKIGRVLFARYVTKSPQRPAPDKWTYHPDRYGFPLVGALSRIHRFTSVWGDATQVSCQLSYRGNDLPHRFTTCYCDAQIIFADNRIVNIHYSKGESCWQGERSLEIQGEEGALFFKGDSGKLIKEGGETNLEVGSSRGLFAIDTKQVIDHLLTGTPLYVHPESSLLALKVASLAKRAVKMVN